MANQAYVNGQSNTGTCTVTAPATSSSGACWNLTYLSVSQAGPTVGPNAKLNIYDGTVAAGTLIFSVFLSAPGAGYGGGLPLGGSVGVIQDIPLPKNADGNPGLQATPGNALTIQVIGTGANTVSINARFNDGLT